MAMSMHERAARLFEIKEEMLDLLRESEQLLRGTDSEDRARSYWWAHIRCALDRDHTYLDRSMTMEETVQELEAAADASEDAETA